MPIDARLKYLIEERKMSVIPEKQDDFSEWLKTTWVPFCVEYIANSDLLQASYDAILSAKITKNDDQDEDLATGARVREDFLFDLFLECNKEYHWFDLKKIRYSSRAYTYLWDIVRRDYREQYEAVEDKLMDYYDRFAEQWFKNKLHCDDRAANKEILYSKAIEAFVQAYNIGFLSAADVVDTVIKNQLTLLTNDNSSALTIIQDSESIVLQAFISFIKSTNIIDSKIIDVDNDIEYIKQGIKALNERIANNKKMNKDYSHYVNSILSDKKFNPGVKKNLSITVNDTDNYWIKNDGLIAELVAKKFFESIDIVNQKNKVFSYSKTEGVMVNAQFLSAEAVNRIDIVNDLVDDTAFMTTLSEKPKVNNYFGSYQPARQANDIEDAFKKIAHQAIQLDNKDEFTYDDTFPLYKHGRSGVKAYLSALDAKFSQELRQQKIEKGYTLYLPNKKRLLSDAQINIVSINGINGFLKQQLRDVKGYVFSCQNVILALPIVNQENIAVVSELVQLLDQAKAKEFTLAVKYLAPQYINIIASGLEKVKNTIVHCHIEESPTDALALEAVNDRARQRSVSFYSLDDNKQIEAKEDLSQQPQPVTIAKINALMENVVELKPVDGTVGIQHQHQYEHDVEQQTEVQIQQSWQIQDAKNVKQESSYRHGVISGEESNSLISWQDIEAACDVKHVNHEMCCKKLGEEILQYHYKGRDLKDLWQRITGNLDVTQQHVIKDYGKGYEWIQHFSRFIPKQISYKTLLTIVRHPYLFQDGLCLDSLPESIGFESHCGALFTAAKPSIDKPDEKPNAFKIKINEISRASTPSSEHVNLLKESDIPSAIFFNTLKKSMNEYQAWYAWRRVFSSLNSLNDQGNNHVAELVRAFIKNAGEDGELALSYAINVLNYYSYQIAAKQQVPVSFNQLQFEYQEIEAFKKGEIFSISRDELNHLANNTRTQLHNDILSILNNTQCCNDDNAPIETKNAYKQLLIRLIDCHQQKLPDQINQRYGSLQNKISQLFDSITHSTIVKLCELGVSHNESRLFSIITMLLDVQRVWGDIGLTDFIHRFLSPAINIASLADESSQFSLKQLLNLSTTEYHWWQQLTLQHTTNSGFADFSILMTAFQQFLSTLGELSIRDSLFMPCPLQGINNLQVGLNRLANVLKKVKKPAEQLRNLSGLDWSVSGAALAASQADYQFLTADMKLNAMGESLLTILKQKYSFYSSLHVTHFDHCDAKPYERYKLDEGVSRVESHLLSEAALLCFHRYIGYQKYSAPMHVYKQLLDAIDLPQSYSIVKRINGVWYVDSILMTKPEVSNDNALIIAQLLPVIAYATTGQRGLDSLPQEESERIAQLKQFINVVFEYSRKYYGRDSDEMQQRLNQINAVGEDDLSKTLDYCVTLCKHHKEDNKISFTLSELTQIIKWCIKSRNVARTLSETDVQFMWEVTPKEEGFPIASPDLFVTCCLLDTYNQYFLDAMTRIRVHNQDTDYVSFINACRLLEKRNFSYENKGRVLRILSLIHFKTNTFFADAYCLIELLDRLLVLQKKSGDQVLNDFLVTLSSLVPSTVNNAFSIDKVQAILEACITRANNSALYDIHSFVLSQCPDFHVDPNVDDIKDADFYQDAGSLEKQFPGLGVFYKAIKTIVLIRYPVLFGEDKEACWNYFLRIINELGAHKQRETVLQMLLECSHEHLDLSAINLWLSALLNNIVLKKDSNIPLTLFKNVNSSLLTHKDKMFYIDVLSQWLRYKYWLSEGSHRCFVNVLNKLAEIDDGHSCLKNLNDLASHLSLMTYRDNYSWDKSLIALIDAATKRKMSILELDKLLFILNEFCNINRNNNNHYYTDEFTHFLSKWLGNIANTFDLTSEIANKWSESNQQVSYQRLLILAQVKELPLNGVYQALIKLSDADLQSLVLAYKLKPIPSERLLAQVLKGELSIAELIKCHTADPHDERNEVKLNKQFNNDELWPYINRVKRWQKNQLNTIDFAQKLPAQLEYINHVGRHEFRFLSLADIQQKLVGCRQLLITAKTDDDKLTAYLTAFALTREAIYKTSVAPAILWPTAVQTLAALSAINQAIKTNILSALFMQMATGEGKSLLAVILAIMTWLKGDPVTVVTHRASLALRDVTAYAPLFAALKIECEQLTADSYKNRLVWRQISAMINPSDNKPEFDGIYYAEFNDIALIRQQRILDTGEDITKMSFIIDEADEIILHNHTDSNLTETIGGFDVHPHAWVFEVLSAYLATLDKRVQPITVKMSALVGFLCMTYPLATSVCQDPEFLAMLPLYLKAAWQAQSLVENKDFIAKPRKTGKGYYAAVLINDKPMPANVTFNGLIQQALHGRLNYESRTLQTTKQFTVAPESVLYSSMSPEAVLHWMQQCGALIALSATIGSDAERLEMQKNHNFQYIKLPKMQSSLRVEYPVQFCQNQKQQLLAIGDICKHYTNNRKPSKSRAILIVVDNIAFAEQLKQHLLTTSKKLHVSMLHAGIDDLSDETLSKVERESGQTNHVLIAMSGLITRGYDTKLSSAKQLVVISTSLNNSTDEVQVKGRGGRVNQVTGIRDKGKFYAVYDLEAELKRFPTYRNSVDDLSLNPELFKQRQYFAHYQHESAMRLQRQLLSVSKNIIQSHYYTLWSRLFKSKSILKVVRDKVLKLFTETLDLMANYLSTVTDCNYKSQSNYNAYLVKLYEDMLCKLPALIGDLAPSDASGIANALLCDIEAKQRQLLMQHNEVLTTGGDEPTIKVYHQWKKGVNFNAYLDAGKQHWGNFFIQSVNSMMLSQEQSDLIQQGKEALKHKVNNKQKKKSDFMMQLKLIINSDQKAKEGLQTYLAIYHNTLARSDDKQLVNLSNEPTPVSNIVDINNTNHIKQALGKGQFIALIHDPLLGKAAEIHFIASDIKLFDHLQKAIHNAYLSEAIDERLVCRLNKMNSMIHLTLDFSGHQFDGVNKKQLFALIGGYYNLNTDVIFQDKCIPSISAMKRIVSDLNDLFLNTHCHFPIKMRDYFVGSSAVSSRKQYYTSTFKPLVHDLHSYYDFFPSHIKQCIAALLRYDQEWSYQDQLGKEYKVYPPCFESLADLQVIDCKRQALLFIQAQLEVINKSKCKESLLCGYQSDCLSQLSKQIALSPVSQSLPSLYNVWAQKVIQYGEEKMTIGELIKRRTKETHMLFSVESPDVSVVCQQIKALGQPIDSLTVSHNHSGGA